MVNEQFTIDRQNRGSDGSKKSVRAEPYQHNELLEQDHLLNRSEVARLQLIEIHP